MIAHISNLPYSVDDKALAELLKNFRVKTSNVVKNKTGTSAGHGFVEFESQEEQQRAIKELNSREIENRKIYLKPAWKN